MIECRVVENASTGDNICGKVIRIISGAGGARGLVAESGNDSSDREDASKPKKKGLIAIALKRVTTMAEGAPKGNSNVPRRVTAMVADKKGSGGNGGGGDAIRAAAATTTQ